MNVLLIARPPTLTMRSTSFIPLALALLSIHCMRAVSAAEDRAAAEQEHVSSCPAPSSSTVAPQAAIEQLLLEVGNLRHDMQELKAAAARPAPGTIVGSTWGKTAFRSCPEGSKAVALPSDKDYYYSLCIAVAASASSSAAAAAAAVAAAAAAVCFFIAAEAAL